MPKIEVVLKEVNGVAVYVEKTKVNRFTARAFRFDAAGNVEYAYLRELELEGARARFYGHVFKRDNFIIFD